MADEPSVDGVTEEELAAQDAEALPPREVMSIVDLGEPPVPFEEAPPSGGDNEFDKYVA